MFAESEGLLQRADYREVPAWDLLVRGIGAPRWVVVLSAVLASAALLGVDYLIDSDAHVLLGFFVVVVAMTWAGYASDGLIAGIVLLGVRLWIDAGRSEGSPLSVMLLGFISGALLLAIGILMTRNFRRLVLAMNEVALRDSLTGLLNTRALQDIAERERARAAASGEPISVAFIDLDHFKQINDVHGHIVGDSVLTAYGETITAAVRSTDVVGRVGGDEFTLVLPSTDHVEASAVLQRIRNRMAVRTDIPLVTATIGYVTFTTPPGSVDEMIKMADDLMYRGKRRRGPNGAIVGKVADGDGRQIRNAPAPTVDIRDYLSDSRPPTLCNVTSSDGRRDEIPAS